MKYEHLDPEIIFDYPELSANLPEGPYELPVYTEEPPEGLLVENYPNQECQDYEPDIRWSE